jgi:hypothetical protein
MMKEVIKEHGILGRYYFLWCLPKNIAKRTLERKGFSYIMLLSSQ